LQRLYSGWMMGWRDGSMDVIGVMGGNISSYAVE
jgi:hypothetical protein